MVEIRIAQRIEMPATGVPARIARVLERPVPEGSVRLWRASFQANRARGTCWAEDPRVAVAYTMNANHGGEKLWTALVPADPAGVLDLARTAPLPGTLVPPRPHGGERPPGHRAPWVHNDFGVIERALRSPGAVDRARARCWNPDEEPFVWEADEVLRASLRHSGFAWLRYVDGWPRGAITRAALRPVPARPVPVCDRPEPGTPEARRWVDYALSSTGDWSRQSREAFLEDMDFHEEMGLTSGNVECVAPPETRPSLRKP